MLEIEKSNEEISKKEAYELYLADEWLVLVAERLPGGDYPSNEEAAFSLKKSWANHENGTKGDNFDEIVYNFTHSRRYRVNGGHWRLPKVRFFRDSD